MAVNAKIKIESIFQFPIGYKRINIGCNGFGSNESIVFKKIRENNWQSTTKNHTRDALPYYKISMY